MGSSESDDKGGTSEGAAASRVVSPPLDELRTLRQPLTDGERAVLDFFLRNLAPEWEIYLHPHLNGMKPDIVLLNPKAGVAVFEIKDWNLDSLEYRPASARGDAVLRGKSRDGKVFSKESPLAQCRRYQKELANVYLPSLYGERLAAITAGVILTRASEE